MKRRSEGGVLKSIKVKERSTAEKKMMETKKSLGTYRIGKREITRSKFYD